jgi:hypothetical protein
MVLESGVTRNRLAILLERMHGERNGFGRVGKDSSQGFPEPF